MRNSRKPKKAAYRRKNVVLRYKFKYERRQRAYKFGQFFAVTSLTVFGLFFGYRLLCGFLFCSDCFKIKTIDIRGGKNISASEISALIPFRPGDNIFAAPVSATERNLRQCKPELKKLSVSRVWQGIVVKFEERSPVAFTKVGGERFGVDNDNKPFPLRGLYAKKALPEIICDDEDGRKQVLDFIRIFAPEAKDVYPKIVRFHQEAAGSVSFVMNDGMKIIWGDIEENKIKPKLKKLDQVLFDAGERFRGVDCVNLCFFDDGRIIVKPKKANS